MGKKLLYILLLIGSLVYLRTFIHELNEPFYASKSEWRGDFNNSMLLTGIQVLQVDLMALLLLLFLVNTDIKNGNRVFFAGILALLVLGGISLLALMACWMKELKSLPVMLFFSFKYILMLYLAGRALKKVMNNW